MAYGGRALGDENVVAVEFDMRIFDRAQNVLAKDRAVDQIAGGNESAVEPQSVFRAKEEIHRATDDSHIVVVDGPRSLKIGVTQHLEKNAGIVEAKDVLGGRLDVAVDLHRGPLGLAGGGKRCAGLDREPVDPQRADRFERYFPVGSRPKSSETLTMPFCWMLREPTPSEPTVIEMAWNSPTCPWMACADAPFTTAVP